MSVKHLATAIAYLQGALHSLEALKESANTTELGNTMISIETSLLWLERELVFIDDETARQKYLAQRQPYMPPALYDVSELEKLTREERIGMFRYDPLEQAEDE